MELAKKCPFLARVPSSFVRKARGPVLVSYAERCPVMSEVLHNASEIPEKNDGKTGNFRHKHVFKSIALSCRKKLWLSKFISDVLYCTYSCKYRLSLLHNSSHFNS